MPLRKGGCFRRAGGSRILGITNLVTAFGLVVAPSPRRELTYYSAGQLRAYRKGDFKIHFYDSRGATEPLAVPELYDLTRDVSERDNLAARRPDVLADMMESVEAHRQLTPVAEPIFDKRFAKYRSEQ